MITQHSSRVSGWEHVGAAADSGNFWLDAGGQPTWMTFTIAAGQNLKIGTILGMGNDDKLYECDMGAGDGSNVPFAILTDFIDTTASGDTKFRVLVSSDRRINFDNLEKHASWAGSEEKLRIALKKADFITDSTYHSDLY